MTTFHIRDDLIADVESHFVKEKLKEGRWEDKEFKEYIKRLALLERFVLHGADSYGEGMAYHALKDRYPEEHKAIYRELDPEGFEKFIGRERKKREKRKEERERREEKKRREREEGKEAWLELGGKL